MLRIKIDRMKNVTDLLFQFLCVSFSFSFGFNFKVYNLLLKGTVSRGFRPFLVGTKIICKFNICSRVGSQAIEKKYRNFEKF